MKKILSVFLITLFLSCTTTQVFADSYGNGGETPADLVINKEVKNPVSNIFVENLGSSDPTYSPGTLVTFRLTVKNGSGETLNPVEIVDTLPPFLTHQSSSVPAAYDSGLRKVTMKLENLVAGESRTIELVAKVSDRSSFASDRTIFCVTNYAKVTAPARPNGDDDNAQFCITTSVGGAQTLPVAGVNDMAALIPFLSLGGIGTVMLFAKSKKA